MKICIFGTGAIGGLMGAGLIEAGEDLTFIARGPNLAALKENGLTLHREGKRRCLRPALATGDPAEAGPQDFVIVATKATGASQIARAIGPLLGPDTAVVTAVNGIPWWYFYKHGGPLDGQPLEIVDPGAAQWRSIGPQRAIGCVVYPAAELTAPGVVEHHYGNRFTLGEPDGSQSARIRLIADALTKAGFKAPVRPRIRDDIWLKLWGNLSFNPVSALTCATLAEIAGDKSARRVIHNMMAEAQEIAGALGVRFSVDIDTRIGWAKDVGEHRTSMLQDLELKRPMEIDALLGVVAELGRLTNIVAPTIETVLALVRLRACTAGV